MLTRKFRRIVQQQLVYSARTAETVATNASTSSDSAMQIGGLFGNFMLQSPKGFQLLANAVEARSQQYVQEIVLNAKKRASDPNEKTTVELVDDLSNEICSAADLTDCVRCMHTDPEYTKAADEAMRFFTILVETLNTTPELYGALKQSMEWEKDRLDPVSERTAKLLLEDFELSGVLLDDKERQTFVDLSDEIFDAGSHFVAGCDRPVALSTAEKQYIKANGMELNGPWNLSRDYPIRQFTHAKYFEHNPEQESFLKRLIAARHQVAQLTGFPSFAHRAQSNSVLGTYENVHKFLQSTIKESAGRRDIELEQIQRIVRDHSQNYDASSSERLGLADVEFATFFRRRQLMENLGSSLSSYFHLDTVLEGFEWLVQQLYGIRFQRSLPELDECWAGNVFKLDVHRIEDNTFLGTIFLDFDSRPSKLQGDCHFTVRCSKQLANGEFQTPIVVLSLSVIPTQMQSQNPNWQILEQTTMSAQQAENFFHEMGHAMHSILGRTKFQHVAGTRCPTDFAEVPSHLMECFFNDPRILQKVFRDRSGRSLTSDQADALVQSRLTFSTIHTTQQAIYSLFDLELHGDQAEAVAQGRLSTTELFGQIYKKMMPELQYRTDYAYHHRISHLVTYGAKYYSYLVARASAALIYERLFSTEQFSQNGQQWAKIQSHGGEYPSDVLLAKALGSAPKIEQLTAILVANPPN